MRSSPTSRFSRVAIITLSALVLATPASAQFGGLKKKIKKPTGQEDSRAAAAASDPTPAQGGSVVLTPDVVNQLITGLKAGRADREAAAKEDTPYGRNHKAQRAYVEAQPKCEAGKQAFSQKADSKLMEKVNGLNQKMLDAQSKQDYKLMQIYQDSSMLVLGGPSCTVRKPEQTNEYYASEREVEVRSEKAAVKASGMSAGEFAMAQERAMAILRGGAPTDVSQSEKTAVTAKKGELEPLLWVQEQPAEAAQAPPQPAAPAPAAAAGPAPDPEAMAAANKMGACMAKNMEAHKSEIESLQKQAEAAQKAGDQSKLMAIAQRLQEIQMAGCMGR
jgi:hypothetical protein